MPLPAKLSVRLGQLSLLTLSLFGLSPSAISETGFEGWYQVDVIVFKPRTTDLNNESWREGAPVYPADITAIYPGEPFNLSQLEQALQSETALPEADEAPALGHSEFAFENLSSRNRNRRVVEAATGITASNSTSETRSATAEAPLPGAENEPRREAENQPLAEPENEIAAGELNSEEPADDAFIRELVQNAAENSYGQIAFSSAKDASSLEAIRRSLTRSSRFDVIDHQSWVQPINAEPTPVMVQAGQRYDDRFEVEGTLSLSRSRFLHVQTDLWYTIFEPRGGARNPYVQGFESTLSEEQLSEYQELVEVERERGQYYAARSHVMMQSRRLRSDELHYIDHPLFGVIIRINRYRVEQD